MLVLDAKPNEAHRKLAQLEQAGKVRAVTHKILTVFIRPQEAGRYWSFTGSIHRNYCMKCHKAYPPEEILHSKGVPRCSCGGMIKPDVVLYEEGLDMDTLQSAADFIRKADILIIGGTSLAVYPAAGLIDYYRGNKLVLINKSATPMDSRADLLIQDSIGKVFSQLEA